MPSPFPGMDPYLEARTVWPGLHQRLITYIAEALHLQLRPKYVATIGERVQLAVVDHHYVPTNSCATACMSRPQPWPQQHPWKLMSRS
jgi:hypothetical protein